MRFQVILNRDGGTLRTLDLVRFEDELREAFQSAGHQADVSIIEGKDLEEHLDQALASNCDVIMVGGGDGSVSTAAGKLMGSDKALAILPAGTMNLFARSLGIPQNLDLAVAAFATGVIRKVDLATANDRIFVHQFSIGLHAKVIRIREQHVFNSRIGKIWASVRAGLKAMFRPPRLRVELELDGVRIGRKTAGIGISNNVFGEGHLPYADDPAGGVLGVYVTRARRPGDIFRMAIQVALGRWKAIDTIEVMQAHEVVLRLLSPHKRYGCAIDGEICPIDTVTRLKILPGALYVLVPSEALSAS